eukprot:TRINITY_DN5615_c0_g1_i2.p1 TRINITY_DN5615_c0_g1~~TRINITY_DN5615_c0_g1_i2.p1  ORF type:complete len:467 (-),score=104.30 TRINITY_DN5615_c0_g1_i2:199-1437(-)
MGAKYLEELTEEDVFEDFAKAIELKWLEIKRLKKSFGMLPVVSSVAASSTASGSGGYSGSPQGGPPSVPKQTVFVKNTFLDLDDGLRAAVLQRSSTTPAPQVSTIQEEDDEDEEEQAEDGAEEQAPGTAPSSGLYKTLTCDGYEPSQDWDWINTQSLGPVAENVLQDSLNEAPMQPVQPVPIAGIPDQTIGMVMVPIESMPPGYVIPMAPHMCFPGCIPVPMDRFGRFPGIMQSMPDAEQEDLPVNVTTTEENKRAQVLQRAFSVASNIYRVRWTVDARKLKSTDREAVSPKFDLSFAGPVTFNMVMRPRAVGQERGEASFRRSRGRGTIMVRCMAESDTVQKPVVTFRIGVGSSETGSRQLKPRGPVRHDFSEKNMCGLPSGQDEWDFGKAVDEQTQTFVICLEILSGSGD